MTAIKAADALSGGKLLEETPEEVLAAREAFNELFDGAFADARDRELDSLRAPYVVQRYMKQFRTILPIYFTSADAGIDGPDADPGAAGAGPTPTRWDAEAPVAVAPLDCWSRGSIPMRKITDRRAVMRAQKPGAPPPPLPIQRRQSSSPGSDRSARDSRERGRPSSAHDIRGRSYSAAGSLRPSSAAALRAGGSLQPSASQPAIAQRGGGSSTSGSPVPPGLQRSASKGSFGGGSSAAELLAAEPEMTKDGYLICRGPEHLQPAFQKAERRRALNTEPDPEQRKITQLQKQIEGERTRAEEEIASIEKRFAQGKKAGEFFYLPASADAGLDVPALLGEPVQMTRPKYARMQPLRPEPFRGASAISAVTKGLLPGHSPPPPPPKQKKHREARPAASSSSTKAEPPLDPEREERLAQLEAQRSLLAQARKASESAGKLSYKPLGSRQPPLRETLKPAQGVTLNDPVDLSQPEGKAPPPKRGKPTVKPIAPLMEVAI